VVTISDVAKRAQVAASTVSRVINNSGYVSREARKRVLAAVEELSYVPNIHAERLRTGLSRAIAFIAMDLTNPFWTEVATAVEDAVREYGYDLVLSNTYGDPERELASIHGLRRRHVDGAIVPWVRTGWAELKALDEEGMCVVVLGRAPEEYQFDVFAIDNVRGGYLATKHLLELGHRQIGLICPDLTRERELGYRRALQEYGLTADESLIYREYTSHELQRGSILVQRILAQDLLPTALFAYNDITAISAWMELEKSGFQVPGDISLVGFDDIAVASLIRDGLTTVALPRYEYGRLAGELLLQRISQQVPCSGRYVTLQPELIVRGSTRPCR
jgi:DNA-binding LacI/PurR family transcriptional regulator